MRSSERYHVPPPAGLGIRNPVVIVSPYARPGYTDSTTATTATLIAFTEHTFGLAPLGTADATAYDYSNSFDFTQTPRPPLRLTQTAVPTTSITYLAAHPMDSRDPT
jgi:phospholipase C